MHDYASVDDIGKLLENYDSESIKSDSISLIKNQETETSINLETQKNKTPETHETETSSYKFSPLIIRYENMGSFWEKYKTLWIILIILLVLIILMSIIMFMTPKKPLTTQYKLKGNLLDPMAQNKFKNTFIKLDL